MLTSGALGLHQRSAVPHLSFLSLQNLCSASQGAVCLRQQRFSRSGILAAHADLLCLVCQSACELLVKSLSLKNANCPCRSGRLWNSGSTRLCAAWTPQRSR